MSSISRRRLGSLVGSVALGTWAAPAFSVTAPATTTPALAAEAATPLTPSQMEQYRKTLPDHVKSLTHLRQFPLAYNLAPDFVFRAAGTKG